MRKPNFYSAVFAIIKDGRGAILFQRRQNTGFRDGLYQLPSGHIEGRESMKVALIRELKEELNIDIDEKDLNIPHIAHTVTPDRVYFNIYMEALAYRGELKNLEISKCSEIVFKTYTEVEGKEEFQYEMETLGKILSGEKFSEKTVS